MRKMYFKPAVSVVDIQNKDGFLLPEASAKHATTNVGLDYKGAGGDTPAVARRQDKLWDYDDEEEEE